MICEFIDGPEAGQREEIADDCREVYCAGLSREVVDWYEREADGAPRFIHRGQLTAEEYRQRVKPEEAAEAIAEGFRSKAVPRWINRADMPDWAK